MAKETFYALHTSKQERILNACIQEFSIHPYSKASINQIIKHAKIPRGSFYQYFENKEDCYLEVLKKISETKLKLYQALIKAHPQDSFFEKSLLMIKAIEDLDKTHPRYHQIGLLMEKDNDPLIEKLLTRNPTLLDSVYQQIQQDQEKGLLRNDVEPSLIYEMTEAIQKHLFTQAAKNKDDKSIYDHAKFIYQLIYEGIKA